ncbi:hypothetical protein P9233_22805 [Schinkia azotoformans]|nr:hypothetical protein [Schinkia azotoformans]MEC1696878.1 hypothetical protein [Schinkia azotoformans]MEC1717849.1 hypothetical protein [Schinkia azotoformans]MEC1727217.1 hypothetical protein [Schinkia azotoformans]MEC1747752.1 hypothetical protein [Schinkia azotoformans]MEC1779944.1 hypothetical protein [Schinkia azotoformans]
MMKDYRLSEKLSEGIVDGIIEGYKDYLRVRKEAARQLKVHGAYAWVKGNHIDHHIAVQCAKFGVEGKLSKAGVTWQYLQFQMEEDKVLFLVKNARYFDPKAVDKGMDAYGRPRTKKVTYMENLVGINQGVKFPKEVETIKHEKSFQLELLEDLQVVSISKEDTVELAKEYNRFYIVTYQIDEEFLINSIKLWMPNPGNNKAYLVEDLSNFINTKTSHIIEMEEETKAILQSSTEVEYDASSYDIALTEDDNDEAAEES